MEKYQKDYTKYIKEHVSNVRKAYKWLTDNFTKDEINFGDEAKLSKLINSHDLSKWSDEEFEPYALYFYVDKEKHLDDFNKAWNHHQKCNPHHWQYWVLMEDDNKGNVVTIPMEQEYIIEMICDWWSFSHKTGNLKEIFNWYKDNKKRQKLHPDTKKEVESILEKIKEKLGE